MKRVAQCCVLFSLRDESFPKNRWYDRRILENNNTSVYFTRYAVAGEFIKDTSGNHHNICGNMQLVLISHDLQLTVYLYYHTSAVHNWVTGIHKCIRISYANISSTDPKVNKEFIYKYIRILCFWGVVESYGFVSCVRACLLFVLELNLWQVIKKNHRIISIDWTEDCVQCC